RPGAVDDVIHQDTATTVDLADDVHDFRLARALAPLVDDGEVGVDAARDMPCAHHATNVRRYDYQIAAVVMLCDVLEEHRRREEIVRGDVEEALDLTRVQIDGEHAVGARGGNHVGNELRRDRRASGGFAVLPRVAVIG